MILRELDLQQLNLAELRSYNAVIGYDKVAGRFSIFYQPPFDFEAGIPAFPARNAIIAFSDAWECERLAKIVTDAFGHCCYSACKPGRCKEVEGHT
jgi:hypothetical protein